MTDPMRVKIGWHTYKVIFGKEPLVLAGSDINIHEDLCGLTSVNQCRIWVDDNQSKSQIQDTLLHEILHAVFDTCGISVDLDHAAEERIVRVLAPNLLSLFRDNPELAEKLGITSKEKKTD